MKKNHYSAGARFRKWVGKIHLWLGLATGIVVVFLGLTGCLLAFEQEIRRFVEPRDLKGDKSETLLPPSVLQTIAEKSLNGKKVNSVEYGQPGKAAVVYSYDAESFHALLLDPRDGTTLMQKDMNRDFFRIVLNGHYYLFLPPKYGQPIVASATLIFFVMMVSGIILWWPKNKAAKKQRFSLKWKASWKRVNYDLHNVLGFYMSWVALFIAITGLVMGFEWVAKSVYWVSSAGKEMPAYSTPVSDTLESSISPQQPVVDRVWQSRIQEKKTDNSLVVYFPQGPAESIGITLNRRPGTFYKTDNFYFDQYTGKQLEAGGSYGGKYQDAEVADKIRRMNYDIHVGAIWGLPGKLLAFFASLIAASLPITGFYIWWGRNKRTAAAKQFAANETILNASALQSHSQI